MYGRFFLVLCIFVLPYLFMQFFLPKKVSHARTLFYAQKRINAQECAPNRAYLEGDNLALFMLVSLLFVRQKAQICPFHVKPGPT